jgi:hypothetical protein
MPRLVIWRYFHLNIGSAGKSSYVRPEFSIGLLQSDLISIDPRLSGGYPLVVRSDDLINQGS